MIKICQGCNKETRLHAKGLCLSCYNMRHNDPEKRKRTYRNWVKRNLEYFRKYYKNHKGEKQMSEIVLKNAIIREIGYLYFIDREGNICRTKLGRKKKQI